MKHVILASENFLMQDTVLLDVFELHAYYLYLYSIVRMLQGAQNCDRALAFSHIM